MANDRIPGNEIIFVVEQAEEGGFTAYALGEPIVTEADSLPELKAMVRDAVRCHFSVGNGPAIIRLHMVTEEVISA